MTGSFDPYQSWFQIPAAEQPPNHYRLLGLKNYESDLAKIDQAVNQRVQFLQDVAGQNPEASQKLLNEIASARLCLLDRETKQLYDANLKMSGRQSPLPSPHEKSVAPDPNSSRGASSIAPAEPAAKSRSKSPESTAQPKPNNRPQKSGIPIAYLIGIGLLVVAITGGAIGTIIMLNQSGKDPIAEADDNGSKTDGNSEGQTPEKNRQDTRTKKKSSAAKKSVVPTKSTKDSNTAPKKKGVSKSTKTKEEKKATDRPSGSKRGDPKTTSNSGDGKKKSTKDKPKDVRPAKPASQPVSRKWEQVIPMNGLIVWLDANDARLPLGPVKTWPNRYTIQENVFARAPEDRERPLPSKSLPVKKQNSINGLPTVHFDGQDEKGGFLVLGDLSKHFPKAATVFCVARPKDQRYNFYVTGPLDGAFRHANTGRVSMFAKTSRILIRKFPDPKTHCFVVECLPSSQNIWIDGEQIVSGAQVDFDPGTFHRIGCPANFDTAAANWKSYWRRQFLQGEIAEILVYNRKLSVTQRQHVENYLHHKWNAGKKYGPPPTPEQFGWVNIRKVQVDVLDRSGKKSVTSSAKQSLTRIIQTNNANRNSQEIIQIRCPFTWDKLSALQLALPVESGKKSQSCAIYQLEAFVVPKGKPLSDATAKKLNFSEAFSPVADVQFAIDDKPRPWLIPSGEKSVASVFFFDAPVVAPKEDAEFVLKIRQKGLTDFRILLTGNPARDELVRNIRRASGEKLDTKLAPDVFALNFGGETMNDGIMNWDKPVPFKKGANTHGYVGGRKRNFKGEYWRTCHEDIEAIRATVKNRRYDLRFVFADPIGRRGSRQFSFSIEGMRVPDFDIKDQISKKLTNARVPFNTEDKQIFGVANVYGEDYIIVDIKNVLVEDGQLDVEFHKGKGSTIISGFAASPSATRKKR